MGLALILFGGPAFAQSNGTLTLDRTSFTSVREYVAGEAIPTQIVLPPNLHVSKALEPVVETMLRQSPTFRRQCLRIADEPGLAVHLAPATLTRRSDVRATTRFARKHAGRLRADISIFPLSDRVELIAHEIEHVIEQLDGVDLVSLAKMPGTGVHDLDANAQSFETTRASRVGRQVAGEVDPQTPAWKGP
jgi:hypothetical protein